MIPNQWYVILESNEIKMGRPIGVTRMGEKLVAWRDSAGTLAVMVDKCPHRGVALSIGQIKNDCIQCPFHGFEFEPSGACTLVPANGRESRPPKALHAKSYPTREAHGFVYLWWGEPRETYPPLPYFDALDERFVYSTQRDHWNTHYSRAIENQLDVVHLPFVHYNTIGAGHKTIVNGPLTRLSSQYPGDHLLEFWMKNEVDSGQRPLKISEFPQPTRHAAIQFLFPNLWHNWIADDLRVFVAFAPIDDENTLMYLRYYHTTKTPILRQIIGFVGGLGNIYIERQDKRVVVTQEPKRSDLNNGEILIQGDSPIIEYRKVRRALLEGREEVVLDTPD